MARKSGEGIAREEDGKGILLVRPTGNGRASADEIFGSSQWTPPEWSVHEVCGAAEAIAYLKEKPLPVVLCERAGDWKALADVMEQLPRPPCLVMTSRVTDRNLWGDVLNLAATMFALLRPPPR